MKCAQYAAQIQKKMGLNTWLSTELEFFAGYNDFWFRIQYDDKMFYQLINNSTTFKLAMEYQEHLFRQA